MCNSHNIASSIWCRILRVNERLQHNKEEIDEEEKQESDEEESSCSANERRVGGASPGIP